MATTTSNITDSKGKVVSVATITNGKVVSVKPVSTSTTSSSSSGSKTSTTSSNTSSKTGTSTSSSSSSTSKINAAYNPNNGTPLYSGQTTTFQGKTYVGTTPVPTKTPTPTQTPTTSFNANQSTYTVKAGDKYDPYTGKPLTNTTPGSIIYKPGTTPTNIPADTTIPPAFNTGDPNQNALLAQLSDFVNKQIINGYQLNPALNIDANTVQKFLDQAKKEVAPYYAQQIHTLQQDVVRNASQLQSQYGAEVANQEQSFQQNLGNFREQQAGAGTAFSGARAASELGQQAAQNRGLEQLGSQYSNKLIDLGRNAEQKLGTSNVNFQLPSISRSQANLGGPQGGFTQTGSFSGYSPGSFSLGEIPMQRTANEQQLKNQYLSEAYQRAAAGRSYQDLFK